MKGVETVWVAGRQSRPGEEERQVHGHSGSRVPVHCGAGRAWAQGPDRRALYFPTTKRTGKQRCLKLLYIEWINNKVLLYSAGNYI